MSPRPSFSHFGGAVGSADFGGAGALARFNDRLMYVAGERTLLEHAAWTDAQVGLVVVAEHHDVVRGGVRELQAGAEVDDRQR